MASTGVAGPYRRPWQFPVRLVALASLALAAGGGAAWTLWSDGGPAVPQAVASPPGTLAQVALPTAADRAREQAQLDAHRRGQEAAVQRRLASDEYAELDDASVAALDAQSALAYEAFAVFSDGAVVFEWPNKAELWDQAMGPVRRDALLAGEEVRVQVWPGQQVAFTAWVDALWNGVDTGGRGQFVSVITTFRDPEGQPAERINGVLIVTDPDGLGHVVGRMPAFDLRRGEAASLEEAREQQRKRMWVWVWSQPPREATGVPGAAGPDAAGGLDPADAELEPDTPSVRLREPAGG